jgi:membrane protein required for colicin V production
MTVFDYGVLLIIGFSVLLSVMRGAVREIMALFSWVASFLLAQEYATRLAPMLPSSIPGDSLRVLAAFLALFLGALLIMSLATIALAELIRTLGLGSLDKGLGVLFGLLRGLVIVCVMVFIGGMTSLPKQPMWQNAMFSAPIEAVVLKAKTWLPDDLAKRIHFE